MNGTAVVLCALLNCCCVGVVHAQTPEDQADVWFHSGRAAAQAKNWSEAYRLFSEAWQIKQTYDIAGNLGQVAYLLEEYAEAAERVSFALRHFPPSGDPSQKQALQRLFELVLAKVSVLHVRAWPTQAEVMVNGLSQGLAGAATREVFVKPGRHRIVAQQAGERVERELEARAGGRYRVDLRLTAPPRQAAAGHQSSARSDTEPSQSVALDHELDANAGHARFDSRKLMLAVGSGMTLAAAAGVGLLALEYSNAKAAARGYSQRLDRAGIDCTQQASHDCLEQSRASDTADRSRRARDVLLGTTVALGGVTAACYWLLPSQQDERATQPWRLYPVATRQQQGLWLQASF